MGLNLTNFAPILKTLYKPSKVNNLVYPGNPLLASLPKATDFFGENRKVPLIYGNPQGRSATFATAQANKGNTASAAFLITRNKNYQILGIDGETLKASANDAGAFLSARKTELDGGFMNISSALDIDLFGTGSGVRGRVSAAQNVALSTVTLSEINDIVKFEVGMQLQASTANGGGAVKAGSAYIISIDRTLGTFVVSSSAGGSATALNVCIGTAAASDYLFAAGDYDSAIKGLQAWLPYGGPSATTFFGVDRTTDSQRLGGVTADFSTLPIEEALVEAGAQMGRVGARPDRVWMSIGKMADLIKSLGSKVQYIDQEWGTVGFKGVRVHLDNMVVDVFSERNCPKESMFVLQSNSWLLHSLGEAPGILNLDTLEALREPNSDGIEIRIGYYAQLSCNAPGWNGHFKI